MSRPADALLTDLTVLQMRARHVLLGAVAESEREFVMAGLDRLEREFEAKLGACVAIVTYPTVYAACAHALKLSLGATINGDARSAERWAAVAFAYLPMLRADHAALAATMARGAP